MGTMARMTLNEPDSSLFAPPRLITNLEDCHFYHTMDLPGYGTVSGSWDLRNHVDEYLGGFDFAGKRVLEVGTASGFLCNAMEKRGADVIGYDLSDKHSWDIVPFPATSSGDLAAQNRQNIRRLNNSWWLAHRVYGSRARVVYGHASEIPAGIGEVDVATFGCILLHLRDPFQALAKAAERVRETIVVTEFERPCHVDPLEPGEIPTPPRRFRGKVLQFIHALLGDGGWWEREGKLQDKIRELQELGGSRGRQPLACFLPDPQTGMPTTVWWYLRPALIQTMLGVLGFPKTKLTYSEGALMYGKPQKLFTIVAHRA